LPKQKQEGAPGYVMDDANRRSMATHAHQAAASIPKLKAAVIEFLTTMKDNDPSEVVRGSAQTYINDINSWGDQGHPFAQADMQVPQAPVVLHHNPLHPPQYFDEIAVDWGMMDDDP
jgi:hypothetical protein